MKRLGEILLARGAISKDQLQSGLTACKRNGGRLGTWLVRLGHIDEATLLTALAHQSGCPPASASDLASAPAEVRSLLEPAFARRNRAVPFARRGRTLDVALGNPNDLVLVEEITRLTGLSVRPYVATEATLATALAVSVNAPASATTPPPGPPTTASREWRQFWRLEPTADELATAFETGPGSSPATSSASFPSLQALDAVAVTPAISDLNELANQLSTSSSREEVARHVIGFLRSLAGRVCLFSLHQGRVMAWAGHGDGIVPEEFNTLILPMDRPSVLLNLAKGADVHVGPLSESEGNIVLLEAMGAPRPREVVAAPVRVRNKVVAFVWLDQPGGDVAAIPVAVVREATRLTGLALEVLVLRQKMRSAGRLTERRQPH
jgi:hypothetical protein